MTLTIRPEGPADADAIRMVLEAAFPTPDEARLVALLRAGGHLLLSLVAAEDEAIVGHIAFSPVRVDGDADAEDGVGLGRWPSARTSSAVASAASSSARAYQHASAPDMASSSCWASRSSIGGSASSGRTVGASGMNTRRMRRSWSWN